MAFSIKFKKVSSVKRIDVGESNVWSATLNTTSRAPVYKLKNPFWGPNPIPFRVREGFYERNPDGELIQAHRTDQLHQSVHASDKRSDAAGEGGSRMTEKKKIPPIPEEAQQVYTTANALMLAAAMVDYAIKQDPTGVIEEESPRLAKNIRKLAAKVDAKAAIMLGKWLDSTGVRLL